MPHEVVCYGEVLWDILPSGEKPGGAPMNVAFHLQKLGLHPAMITRVGDDDYGRRLLQLLHEHKVTTYEQTDAEHTTGLVNATLKENNEVAYDILFPSAWDFIEWRPSFVSLLQQAQYFVFGSLITRNKTSRDTLFQLLEAAPVKVLDINLRPPHFSQGVLEDLLQRADILKLNENELPLIAGWYGQWTSDRDQVNALQDRFAIRTILVTKGAEGALLNKDGRFYEQKGFEVTVADTVGCGDAFLAGFLFQLLSGAAPQEMLQFANGLGAFNAQFCGACPDYTLEDVKAFIEQKTTLPASV